MISIYSDSLVIDREWLPRVNFHTPIEIVQDLGEFERSAAEIKIAFTGHRLHVQHDADMEYQIKFNRLSDCSDLVFIFESELHNAHWDIWTECPIKKSYWVVPGSVNDRPDINSHIIFWGDWFKTTANLYKRLPEKLLSLRPYDIKPKYFDALLGVPKPHREFVFNKVQEFKELHDRVIMTYGGAWSDDQFYAQDYFIWEPDCRPMQKIIGTADWVDYCGVQAHLSQVIPIQVYNDSAYSIIAETDHDNTLSFFSEKTSKPLIARRLFVAFSGYRFLSNLRQLGFKTFDGIIDESYDDIFNDDDRYAAAFEQVHKLCSMDQAQVLEMVRPIVDHNHDLIMQRDWTKYAINGIQSLLDQRLNTLID